MRLNTESMVSALLGDEFGASDIDLANLTMSGLSLDGDDDEEEEELQPPYTNYSALADLALYSNQGAIDIKPNQYEATTNEGVVVLGSSFTSASPFAASPLSEGFLPFGSPLSPTILPGMMGTSPSNSYSPPSGVVPVGKDEAFEMLLSMFGDYERYFYLPPCAFATPIK